MAGDLEKIKKEKEDLEKRLKEIEKKQAQANELTLDEMAQEISNQAKERGFHGNKSQFLAILKGDIEKKSTPKSAASDTDPTHYEPDGRAYKLKKGEKIYAKYYDSRTDTQYFRPRGWDDETKKQLEQAYQLKFPQTSENGEKQGV